MRYTKTPYEAAQCIDPGGNETRPLPEWTKDTELLRGFYKTMLLARLFDQKTVALQRTGKIGTFPPCIGQEAIGTGIGFALRPDDVFIPYYRDVTTQYLRGLKLEQLLLYWGGDERGNLFEGVGAKDFPMCVPIATQVTHAAGVASAMKIRHQKSAALVTCGDGATSRGDFFESLNVAGVWQLPMVVVVNNNQWAISVPRHLQSGAATIAQKAVGAGIEGFQLDGNDVCAVYDAVHYALEKARHGKGATLIEAISYRLGDHTTADDATRYRDVNEVNAAWQKEPIKRLRLWLHQRGHWDEQQERDWQAHCATLIDQAVQAHEGYEEQSPGDLLDYLYDTLPAAQQEQREQLIRKANRLRGGHHGH